MKNIRILSETFIVNGAIFSLYLNRRIFVMNYYVAKTSFTGAKLTLNYDAVPNYKYMFGPHRVIYLICETLQ